MTTLFRIGLLDLLSIINQEPDIVNNLSLKSKFSYQQTMLRIKILVESKLIKSYQDINNNSRSPRMVNYYEITDKGRFVLDE